MSTSLHVIKRRQVLAGSAVSAAALASGFPAPAIGASQTSQNRSAPTIQCTMRRDGCVKSQSSD